jgi:hypothetical protein
MQQWVFVGLAGRMAFLPDWVLTWADVLFIVMAVALSQRATVAREWRLGLMSGYVTQ